LGEEIAVKYLEEMGQIIIGRNWRYSHLEVDIISSDEKGIHFVEVKSRVAPLAADPTENVDYKKRERLKRAAIGFLAEHPQGDAEIFFDVLTVVFDGEKTEIDYIQQAFIPIYV